MPVVGEWTTSPVGRLWTNRVESPDRTSDREGILRALRETLRSTARCMASPRTPGSTLEVTERHGLDYVLKAPQGSICDDAVLEPT